MRLNGRINRLEKEAAKLPWHHGLTGENLAAAMRQFDKDVATVQGLIASGQASLDGLQAMLMTDFVRLLDHAI